MEKLRSAEAEESREIRGLVKIRGAAVCFSLYYICVSFCEGTLFGLVFEGKPVVIFLHGG